MSRRCVSLCKMGMLLFVAVGCTLFPEREKTTHYLNVERLLGREAHRLASNSTLCQKYMKIDDTEQVLSLQQDSSQWMRSWRHILQFDLNKATHFSLYDSSTYQMDSLYTTIYQARFPSDTQLQSLTLFRDSIGTLLRLKARFREENSFYSRAGEIGLRFSEEERRLRYYALEGYQKVRTQDTIRYEVVWNCP